MPKAVPEGRVQEKQIPLPDGAVTMDALKLCNVQIGTSIDTATIRRNLVATTCN